jgi:tryptophan synthase alpha chain
MSKDAVLLVNLSGRGDKDMHTVAEKSGDSILMSRIKNTFDKLAGRGRKALIPFITAGDPDPALTLPLMRALVAKRRRHHRTGRAVLRSHGRRADHPARLGAGAQAWRVAAPGAGHCARIPCRRCRYAGGADGLCQPDRSDGRRRLRRRGQAGWVDGVLVVDYPPEECDRLCRDAGSAGIDPIFLLAPTSTEQRIGQVARSAAATSTTCR